MSMNNIIYKIKPKEVLNLDSTLTEAQKASILSKTMLKIQAATSDIIIDNCDHLPVRRGGLKKRLILILAATLILSAIAVLASNNLNVISRFKELLNLTEENQQLVDGMWSEINESKTVGDYTVTLVGSLGDDNSIALLLDVKFPEGTDFDKDYSFDIYQLDSQHWYGPGIGGGTQTTSPIVAKVDEANSTISYILNISSETIDYRSSKLRFWLKDIYRADYSSYNDGYDERELICEGEWIFYFNLDYSSNSVIYNVDKIVKGGNSTIDIKQIKLSPLSITIIGESDDFDKGILAFIQGIERGDFFTGLMMKNGEFLDYNSTTEEKAFKGGSLTSTVPIDNKRRLYFKTTFENIMNPDNVESVVIYGEEFKLSDLQVTDKFNDFRGRDSSRAILIASLSYLISIILFFISSIKIIIRSNSSFLDGYEKRRHKLAKKQKQLSFKAYIRTSRRDLLIEAFYLCFQNVVFGAIAVYLISLIIRNAMLWQTVAAAIIITAAVILGIIAAVSSFKTAFSIEKYFKI